MRENLTYVSLHFIASYSVKLTLIPPRFMAMTNGEEAAVPSSMLRPGSLEGTKRPMTMTPQK